jgi:hypothetical protein
MGALNVHRLQRTVALNIDRLQRIVAPNMYRPAWSVAR